MRTRLILPDRLRKDVKPWDFIKEGDFSDDELKKFNRFGYNVYHFPNHNSAPPKGKYLCGDDIDVYNWLFVDMDLKDGIYESKEDFISTIKEFQLIPTKIIDSGNGIHVYWKTSGLTRDLFISTQKRLIHKFNTDKSIFTPLQLMRLEGFNNTKKEELSPCFIIEANMDNTYDVSDFDKILPVITKSELEKAYKKYSVKKSVIVEGEIPKKFLDMLDNNENMRELYYSPKDRSAADYKLARVLLFNDFKYNEAVEVLCTTQKGAERGTDYAISTVERAYSEPVTEFSLDYKEVSSLVNKKVLRDKLENEVKEYRLEKEYNKVKREKEKESRRGTFSFKGTESLRKAQYKSELELLKQSIQSRLFFITDRLTDVVGVEGVEMILLAAVSGSGKTTASINIIDPLIKQNKKILYISTEERGADIYSRIACLRTNLNYTNKRNWSDEEWSILNEEVEKLVDEGNIVIMDSYTQGVDAYTGKIIDPLDMTYLEDFQNMLDSVRRDNLKFDLVILDYISKISSGADNEEEWKIIYKASKFIEEYCKSMKIPAIVFSQLKDKVNDRDTFQSRLPGSKRLLNVVSTAIEINTDFETKTATFIAHKNRNNGTRFVKTVKYERGKYVDFVGENDSIELNEED